MLYCQFRFVDLCDEGGELVLEVDWWQFYFIILQEGRGSSLQKVDIQV